MRTELADAAATSPAPDPSLGRPGWAKWGSAGIVWTAWVAMTAAALMLVVRYGSNVPSWDDWDMVPVLTGHQPVTAGWLWSQHNEHRIPIPRLVLVGLAKVFGIDFRIPMVANVLATAAVGAAAILVAARLRGRASITDAFFPLVLLHWGHAVNFIWGWQVQFFSSAVLAGVALLAVAVGTRPGVAAAAACAVLLPLCGANGLGMTPALAVWLVTVAVLWWRLGRRGAAAAVAAAAAVGTLLSGLYFVGYEPVPYHPTGGTGIMLRTTPKFVTLGWGPVARAGWPWLGLVTMAAGVAAVWWAGRAFVRSPAERVRAAGIVCFVGAIASLALGLGRSRDGFELRYVALAVPGLMAVYLATLLYAPRRMGGAVQVGMLLVAAASLWPNSSAGATYAANLRGELTAFERAAAAGTPVPRLAARFREWLHPHDDVISEYLPMLSGAGIHPYSAVPQTVPLRELDVPLDPASAAGVDWDPATSTATVRGSFADAHLEFALPAAVHAAGIRLRYVPLDPQTPAPYTSVSWAPDAGSGFEASRRRKVSATGDRHTWGPLVWTRINDPVVTQTAWVDGPVAKIRVAPDLMPGRFRLISLTVLVPAE